MCEEEDEDHCFTWGIDNDYTICIRHNKYWKEPVKMDTPMKDADTIDFDKLKELTKK